MKDKPKMYQNRVNKEFHNNRLIYMSSNKEDDKNILGISDIRKKINDIIGSNTFIYSKLVHIVIGNETITRKIIGIYNNNLITIDNEYIPLDNIRDIYI